MELVRQNFAAFFRTLQILFFALLGGQVAVLAVIEFLLKPRFGTHEFTTKAGQTLSFQPGNEDFSLYVVVYGVPLLAFGMLGLAFFLFRKTLTAARAKADLSAKLLAYRTALILKWAFIE